MEYKILEANGVENENVDGAAFNNFTAAGRNGIIKGVLNECEVYSPSSNSVSVKTGELIIQGFRIKITDPYVITFSSTPAMPIRYQLVAKIVLGADRSVSFGIEYREEKELVKEDLYQAERGTYEVILAWFTHSEKGIVDLVTSVKTITIDTLNGLSKVATSGNYNDLLNLPVIPIVYEWALAERKPTYSYEEITNKPTIPTKTSQLTNDIGYITNSALTPYAKTENTYTKTETDKAISKAIEEAITNALEGEY